MYVKKSKLPHELFRNESVLYRGVIVDDASEVSGISRVQKFRSGPKFHRLSVSWPYSCVKSLKKVGHLSLEIWAFVTPKRPLSCVCKDISSSDI